MLKYILLFLMCGKIAFSQPNHKTKTYHVGHNGMEYVVRSNSGTVIISTYNSKMTIRQEIAQKIYDMFKENKIENNSIITIEGIEAAVIGRCIIRKQHRLILVDFYYETVNWKSGVTEIFKKNVL
jgi:hypothetical protein